MCLYRWSFLISFCLIFILATDISFAAGLIARIQQKKAQRQNPQGMTQEQYQQYQEYQEQQQGTHGQQAPAPPTYQQLVDQRNQAIAQAILNAHNASVSTVNAQDQQQSSGPSVAPQAATSVAVQAGSGDVRDTVDLSEVWKKLDKKSTVWGLLMDDQAKVLTVSEYIDRFRQEGVKINAPPIHYVQMIDQIVAQNPQLLQRPFGELIQMMAIVEYDFDNGMNKDDLAKKVLGEAGYEANKQRFAQQTQQAQQQQPNGGAAGQ